MREKILNTKLLETNILMKIRSYDKLPSDALRIRITVFADEQGFVDHEDETDGHAIHFLLFDDTENAVATCRLFKTETVGEYALGRFAVLKEYRGRALGSLLLDAVEEFVSSKGGKSIILHSQLSASGFYLKNGFLPCAEIDLEQDCPHLWMKKELISFDQ